MPSGEKREEKVEKKLVYVRHSFGTTENNEKAKKIESRKPEKTIVKRAFFRNRAAGPERRRQKRDAEITAPEHRFHDHGEGVGVG